MVEDIGKSQWNLDFTEEKKKKTEISFMMKIVGSIVGMKGNINNARSLETADEGIQNGYHQSRWYYPEQESSRGKRQLVFMFGKDNLISFKRL